MLRVDAGVNDVCECTCPSGIVVDILCGASVAMGDSCKSIRRVRLNGICVYSRVWFYGLDRCDRAQETNGIADGINGEALEAAERVLVCRLNASNLRHLGKDVGKSSILVDLDDPGTGNVILLSGLKKDRGSQHSRQGQKKTEERRTHCW